MSVELAETLKQKGNEAFSNGEWKKAAKIYRDAIKLNPSNPVLYSNRAICFIKLNDYARALKDCESGLELSSQDLRTTMKLYYRQYLSFSSLNNDIQARGALEKARALDPNNKLIIEALQKLKVPKPPQLSNEEGTRRKIDIVRVDEIPLEFRLDESQPSTTTNKIKEIVPNIQFNNRAINDHTSTELLDDPPQDWKEKKLRFFGVDSSIS